MPMANPIRSHRLPPLQDRSRASQDRLLKAARELIEEKGFEKASLREICGRAGLTSGAFYARFSGKRDLALYFLDGVAQRFEEIQQNFAADLTNLGLEAAIRHMFVAQTDYYRTEATVLRGLVAIFHNDPEIAQAARRINNQYLQPIQLILEDDVTINHPDPPRALRLGFLCTLTTLVEIILNQHLVEDADAYDYDDETLTAEMTRMFLNYLEV